ncbi:hypothetical protein HX773_19750, partial [Pantoea sp. B9002]|uniref:hypothetical protein n=1 Tax=Pantoea sp. B9002 TaxID=2726979 RepID=UPI0015A4690F
VEIWINDELVETVVADRNGYWNYTPRLAEGVNQVFVVSQGISSQPFDMTYAPHVEPVEPVDQELSITGISDMAGSDIGPGGSAISNDVVLSGTGPRYQVLEIWSGDRFVGNVWTDQNGTWYQYVTLPEGNNSLTVRAGDVQSEAVMILTPIAPPPVPEIFSAWEDESNVGSVFNGGTTSDATPRLEGRAGN